MKPLSILVAGLVPILGATACTEAPTAARQGSVIRRDGGPGTLGSGNASLSPRSVEFGNTTSVPEQRRSMLTDSATVVEEGGPGTPWIGELASCLSACHGAAQTVGGRGRPRCAQHPAV